MADTTPFGAEHVASLPRPDRLLAARERFAKGEIPRAELAAEKFVPLDQLARSPQCGFSSVAPVGRFPLDLVERKLARAGEVADAVWG